MPALGLEVDRSFRQIGHVFVRAVDIGRNCIKLGGVVILAERFGKRLGSAEAANTVMAHALILRHDDDVANIIIVDIRIDDMLLRLFDEAFHALAMLFLALAAILQQLLHGRGMILDTLGSLAETFLELGIARFVGQLADHFRHLNICRPVVGQFFLVAIFEVFRCRHSRPPF